MPAKIQVNTNSCKIDMQKLTENWTSGVAECGVQTQSQLARKDRDCREKKGGSEYQEQRLERILVFGPEAANETVNLSEGGETAA